MTQIIRFTALLSVSYSPFISFFPCHTSLPSQVISQAHFNEESQGYTHGGTCNAAMIAQHLFLIIRAHLRSNSYCANTAMSSTVNVTGSPIKQTFVLQIEKRCHDTAVNCIEILLYYATCSVCACDLGVNPSHHLL